MSGPLTKSRIALLAVVLLATVIVAIWLAQPDPRLVQARLMQQRLASAETRRLPPAQQLDLQNELHAAMQHLSPAQLRVLQKDRRRLLIEKIEQFRALPPAEQNTFLDEEIDRLRGLRRELENATSQPTGPGSTGKSARRRSSGGGTTTGTGRGTTGPSEPNDLEHVLKRELDASTPEQRALVSGFLKQLFDRWKAMGMLRGDVPDDMNALLGMMQ